MQPVPIPLTDPFRFHQTLNFDRQKSIILDVFHQVALILQAIQEQLAPAKGERNEYDKILLDQFGGYLAGDPLALETALRLFVLYEDVIFPNIDILPGKLFNEYHAVRLGRSVRYEWYSDEFQAFADSLQPLVLLHPIARHLGITSQEYARLLRFARDKNFLWSSSQGPRSARNGIVVSAILQDIRTALIDAHTEGVAAASIMLNDVPSTPIGDPASINDLKGQDMLVKLYFDHAVYSPKLSTVREALEIRQNPRIEKWRSLLRQWQADLPRGAMSFPQAAEAIAEANSYIRGAKFAHHLVPRWVHVAFWPFELLALGAAAFGHHPPEAIHLVAAGLTGAQVYGYAVWKAVSRSDPDRFGWYLLPNEAKQNSQA